MQIVIKIPDLDYFDIKHGHADNFQRERLVESVKCSIAIPKNHGRLIDADKIILEATERMKYPANHEYMECVIAHMNLAPTIIEADKESEDKE